MERAKNLKIKLNKVQGELRNKARISECFHHKKEECQGEIKNAHSIQRNGRLSVIEGNVNGNQCLYSFTETELNPSTQKLELKPIGKAKASTFFGFCDYHDSTLFSPIENYMFDNSDKHCFLHSYRAFAHTQHKKIEQLKAFTSDAEFNEYQKFELAARIEGTKIGIADGERVRRRLEQILDDEAYDELDYFTMVYDQLFPVACSASFTPKFSPKSNRMLNYHPNVNAPFQLVFLTVLPDFEQTIIIMGCLPEHEKSVLFIDEFASLSSYQQNKMLTSILIGIVENTFIAPALYEALGKEGKNQLLKELEETSMFALTIYKSLYKSKLNFFQSRFSAKSLGIKNNCS